MDDTEDPAPRDTPDPDRILPHWKLPPGEDEDTGEFPAIVEPGPDLEPDGRPSQAVPDRTDDELRLAARRFKIALAVSAAWSLATIALAIANSL